MPLSAWARLHIGVIGRRIQRPEQLDFTGQELADIIAFAHDPREQRKFSEADVPWALRRLDLRAEATSQSVGCPDGICATTRPRHRIGRRCHRKLVRVMARRF